MQTTMIQGDHYRFTFLTSRLVRMEYQREGRFTDGSTQMAVCRDFPPVTVTRTCRNGMLLLETEHLRLAYDEGEFSMSGLTVTLKGNMDTVWRYGQACHTLGGTARTLDEADGEIPLQPGLVSRRGIVVTDDSQAMLLDQQGQFSPRPDPEIDLYCFAYGHDYAACIRDFYALSGAIPLLPRFALGNWWSRYYPYRQAEYLQLMDDFAAHDVPLAVAVIDMDWHLTDVPFGSGWTGYTWNRDLFPEPEAFLKALHDRGLKVTLNLHPAAGVQPHEDAYPAMREKLGVPEGEPVAFDVTNKAFMHNYLTELHHPLEKQGVDFWWIDWQQGTESGQKGLDPLWVLNDCHYRDACRDGKRGLILSRYAGLGSHRYPVGFSGDTVITWESLAFQPYFTACATNVGYCWWSHDIGGHMQGARDDELSVRWLQYGVFSPILRLHSSNSEFSGKEPWHYGIAAEQAMEESLRLRDELLPYLDAMNHHTAEDGMPTVRPMYYAWPEMDEAYRYRNQYLFGSELMVCPITQPQKPALGMACVEAWLPAGQWIDFFNGTVYAGDRQLKLYRGLADYPVLAKAGAIVPMKVRHADMADAIRLRIFGGEDGHFTLYEDDGMQTKPAAENTQIDLDWQGRTLTLRSPRTAAGRRWHIELVAVQDTAVTLKGTPLTTAYDADANTLSFDVPADEQLVLGFADLCLAENHWLAAAHDRLLHAQSSYPEKDDIWRVLKSGRRDATIIGTLRALCRTPELADCLEEVIFAQ